jgi:peroxiredoxin
MRAILAFALSIVLLSTAVDAQDPTGEFQQIIDELTRKQSAVRNGTMSAPELFDLAERLLLGFIEKYPDAPDGAKAHLLLGQIYTQASRSEEAVRHLGAYLASEAPKGESEAAMAKSMLAGAYITLENFDAAEKLLREVVESGAAVDRRITAMASSELARIGTLKRLKVGLPAIAFTAETVGGETIRLEDYHGKVVLLDFWASWCAPCRQEMPNVKEVYNRYHEKGFEIIGISLDNSRAQFDTYMKEQKMPWPQIYDGKGWMSEVGRTYAVSAIPATFLIDREGTIRHKNVRGSELGKAVGDLIGER